MPATTAKPAANIVQRITSRRYDWLAALILLAAGAYGFYTVVTTIPPISGLLEGGLSDAATAQRFYASPNVGGVVLLLLALGVAVLGGAWFVVRLLHWRFRPTFEPLKVWRQSLWAAVFVTIGAWLQLNRSLTLVLGTLLAGALILLEVFLNVRERQE
jgi:drug/metabolite transporter (DMT)-like permease